ncbi:MAG: hypothetical protein K8W52_00345 [Deltaproteobacteria bacterium]|nr:hypothetical protein [Deltaproteobacteria bacterium]
MSRNRALLLGFASLLSLAACATEVSTDELAAEGANDAAAADAAEGGKADSTGQYTYFLVTPDMRRCASPKCGGFWVDRINLGTTKCADGTYAEKCYVAELNLDGTGLPTASTDTVIGQAHSATSQVLLRGTIAKKSFGANGTLGVFKATEAWLPTTDAPADGVFVKLKDAGVRCITTPCPSTHELKLNSSSKAVIADVDFSWSGATDEQIAAAVGAEFGDGLIIAGDRYTVHGQAGNGKARTATQLWTKVLGPCFVGGCSGQICSDEEGVISTCIYKPEYACYHNDSTACERQTNGACEWTQTDALLACLADPPTP